MPLNSSFLGLDDGAGEKTSILIVDDLAEKLLVFETVLQPLGQELVFVRSGTEALREILKREFAVILLDVNMPDIDGFETAEMIRKYKRSALTPIIFITSYADEVQMAQGYSLGAVDYILSPVMPEMLRAKVKVFVELHIMQRRMRRQAAERIALATAEAARQAAEENTRRSTYLSQASRVLSGSLDAGVGMRSLLKLAVPELSASATLVLLENGEPALGRAMTCEEAASGEPSIRERLLADLPAAEQRGIQQALSTRCRVVLRPGGDAGVADPMGAAWPGEPLAGTVVPLVIGERCLGALLVHAGESMKDWTTLDELANRAAIAFENARLYRSLQTEIDERRRAETRLQEANRRKDEFLAMLSHELRNPLAPIRNAVQVIRLVAPPHPKLTWATDVTERQVSHLTRLVEDLLDVARISQGKVELKMAPMDLLAAVSHGVETVLPFIESRRIALTQSLPAGPVWLRGDAARLSQVIANLLNNAAKYTEEGGRIHLSLSTGGGQAVLSVKDNGTGIDAELLPHVFELFEQGKRSLDRTQGGLGVGLTLVQRLVQLHQGEVLAVSAGPGQGAEFRVTLPCLGVAPQPEAPAGAEPAAAQAGPCRVLVVDDNHDAAETTALFLELAGHEVKAVGDGMQALACVDAFAPDVVVLDIGLPLMDGYEVARRLRTLPRTRGALLIALTGYGQQGDRALALESGFDEHLVKPVDPDTLARLVAERAAILHGPGGAGAAPAKIEIAR
jgi:signal transduction histidine kinase/DNA-binding response OmpR family regulator